MQIIIRDKKKTLYLISLCDLKIINYFKIIMLFSYYFLEIVFKNKVNKKNFQRIIRSYFQLFFRRKKRENCKRNFKRKTSRKTNIEAISFLFHSFSTIGYLKSSNIISFLLSSLIFFIA